MWHRSALGRRRATNESRSPRRCARSRAGARAPARVRLRPARCLRVQSAPVLRLFGNRCDDASPGSLRPVLVRPPGLRAIASPCPRGGAGEPRQPAPGRLPARSAERAPSARRRARARRARSPSRPGHAARERGEPPGCRTRPRAEPRSSSRLLRTARHPPVLERDDELEPELTLAGIDRPCECHAHVVALGDDDVVPLRAWRLRVEVRGASKREVVLGVLPPNRCVLTRPSPAAPRRARGSSRASSSAALAPRCGEASSCPGATGSCPGLRRRRPLPPRTCIRRQRRRARERALCSAGSSRSYDHSIVARSVCWRGSAPDRP